jgi:hypothetical protein
VCASHFPGGCFSARNVTMRSHRPLMRCGADAHSNASQPHAFLAGRRSHRIVTSAHRNLLRRRKLSAAKPMNINNLDPGASINLLRSPRTPSTTTLTRSATMTDDDCLGTDLAADLCARYSRASFGSVKIGIFRRGLSPGQDDRIIPPARNAIEVGTRAFRRDCPRPRSHLREG